MRRAELAFLLAFAVLAVSAGLTWLFGAWALVGSGAATGVAAFVFEVHD